MNPQDRIRGFYLHGCWSYAYPFAVKTWSLADFEGMFELLHRLGLNTVMMWPMSEALPPPLSEEDANWLSRTCAVIDAARRQGLSPWVTLAPCISSAPAIREQPPEQRHFYPHLEVYRVDDPQRWPRYVEHLTDVLRIVDHADAYVMIDGDPGGYPHAAAEDFHRLLVTLQDVVRAAGRPDLHQQVIPWIWNGWGRPTGPDGFWAEPVEPYSRAVMQHLRDQPLAEPWTLLPGRSHREQHANGRVNLSLADELGLISRSVSLLYEIVEFEPTPPAFTPQFDLIRSVVSEELPLIHRGRGVMTNAQQPLTSLANLYYFARALDDPNWLTRGDDEVLVAFSEFLGGDPQILAPALSASQRDLASIPSDLPEQVRGAALYSPAARCLPGGSERYLNILAAFVEARIGVLRPLREPPAGARDAAQRVAEALTAMYRWWDLHQYVFSGEGVIGFDPAYCHACLAGPLRSWIRQYADLPDWTDEAVRSLGASTPMNRERIEAIMASITPQRPPA